MPRLFFVSMLCSEIFFPLRVNSPYESFRNILSVIRIFRSLVTFAVRELDEEIAAVITGRRFETCLTITWLTAGLD